jgi:DNA adenine methylase
MNLAASSSKMQSKPFVKWVGGKTQLLPEILKRIPSLESKSVYHEPFIGGGAVYFALKPKNAIISDVNPELINAYLAVRDFSSDLIQDLRQHVYEEKYYYSLRSLDRFPNFATLSSVKRASRLIYLNKSCYNGLYRVNSRGQFNTPFGRYVNPNFVDESNLLACSQTLAGTKIVLSSFHEIINRTKQGDFVYFDPPYFPTNNTANFTTYSKDGFDEEMQHELASICREIDLKGVKFMLSNSAVPFTLALYKNFNVSVVKAGRAINSQGSKRGKIEEILVTNY